MICARCGIDYRRPTPLTGFCPGCACDIADEKAARAIRDALQLARFRALAARANALREENGPLPRYPVSDDILNRLAREHEEGNT